MTWDELKQKYANWLKEEACGKGRKGDIEALEEISEWLNGLDDTPQWEDVQRVITDAWGEKLHVDKDTWKIYHKLIDDLENIELPEEENE